MAFIVSAECTAASKPDPAPFLLAMDELRRAGHVGGAVVVEDSTGGVAAAKRAGLRCIAVMHSCSRGELLRAGADAVVADLASVTDALLEAGA
jgi:beta-phosphoglucomutase-like phosphatase (HAD superfamily)